MSWIDLLVIGLIVFYVVTDFNRGFIRSVASLVSFVVSLFVAGRLYRLLYDWLVEDTKVYTSIKSFIEKNFFPTQQSGESGFERLDLMRFPQGAREYLQRHIEGNGSYEVVSDVSVLITDAVLYILCFIAVFILARVAISLVVSIFDVIAKLPVLHFMNKTGGLVIGVIEGLIVNLIVINLIYTFAILFNIQSLINGINNASIAPYFYFGYLFF
ncbi:MAG TPA: hypothetical protein DHN33_02175 [Eubacteriaceae bacterium]|nr:hypothetical protein [Eubacteriaceae bacterium]